MQQQTTLLILAPLTKIYHVWGNKQILPCHKLLPCIVKYHGAIHYAPDFCKVGMGMIKINDIVLAFILHQYCISLSRNTPQTLTLCHVSRRDLLMNCRWISRSLRKIKSNLFLKTLLSFSFYEQKLSMGCTVF